jgi:hypothetical protein
MARLRFAQQVTCALEPQGAHIGGKREAGPNDCLQARRSNATVNAGANEIALRIENIRQQFPQMPISERRNRRGKPAYGRYERDEIRLQNESCGSVDGDRLVEPALGVRSDAARGLAAEPQRGAAKTMGARECVISLSEWIIASPGPTRASTVGPCASMLFLHGSEKTRESSPSRTSSAVRLTTLGVERRSMIETFGKLSTRSRV